MDAHGVERALLIGHWDVDDGSFEGPLRNRTNNDMLDALAAGGGRFRGLRRVNMRGQGAIVLEAIDEHLRKDERLVGMKSFLGCEAFSPNDRRCESLPEEQRPKAMYDNARRLFWGKG